MVEVAEAKNPKGTYLFCMLELLKGADLGSLKENENMGWLRDHVARQLLHEVSDDWVLHVTENSWLRCHSRCQLIEVPGLNPEPAVDYYNDDLCMHYRANK